MKRFWRKEKIWAGPEFQPDRERWVIEQFLLRRGIPFRIDELHSPPQSSKVDVEFRDAKFQVKVIADPDCRYTAETKERADRVLNAKSIEDTVYSPRGRDVPPPVDGHALLLEQAVQLAGDRRYAAIRASLDLFFYLTRTRTSPIDPQSIDRLAWKATGWRSVSYLAGNSVALTIHAGSDAPIFLRESMR